QPSISGTSTFKQFFSVRTPRKPWGSISGTIDVGLHFQKWAEAGMQLGTDFDYMVLATEGYDGNNNASGDSSLTITEGPGEPVDCGNQGGTPVCCSITADPNRDGMGEQGGNACVVTPDTEGWHEPNADNILAAINVGGTGLDVQMDGIWYEPNRFVMGAQPFSTTDTVAGANSSVITTEGYGENITIDIPMSNQWVSVDLSFAEMYQTEIGQRAFSVSIEDEEVLTNVDLFDEVGHDVLWQPGPYVVQVTDGSLNISLTSTIDNATISAVLVTKTTEPVASSSAPASSSSVAVSSSSVASSSAEPVASSSAAAVSSEPVASSSAAAVSSAPAASSSSSAGTVALGSFNGWFLMLLGSLLLVMRRVSTK
ncbi:MAG TPA: glycoside hydrolase family 11 protein, partial [Marinagarivorans sp.]